MARRSATQEPVDTEATAPEVTEEQVQDQVTVEDQTEVELTEGEGDQSDTEGEDGEKADKAKAKEPDLTEFKAAVAETLEEADETAGTLPLAGSDRIGTAYRKLDGQKAKNAAKAFIEQSIRDAIGAEEPSMRDARAYVEMRNALAAATASKSTAPKEPVDPTLAYANRLASLWLASSIVSNEVPEGADAEKANTQATELVGKLAEQVEQYRTWVNTEPAEGETKPDAPEVSAVVKTAFKLATGKASGAGRSTSTGSSGPGYSGPSRSIVKHLKEAFAGQEVGTFLKVSEIAKFKSDEYGEDRPSQGAVTAGLFKKDGEAKLVADDTIQAVDKTADHPKGARKVA